MIAARSDFVQVKPGHKSTATKITYYLVAPKVFSDDKLTKKHEINMNLVNEFTLEMEIIRVNDTGIGF